MIVNPDLTNVVINQIKNKKETNYYKFYIEVRGNKYFLKKMERFIAYFNYKKGFDYFFYKKECDYKILEDNSVLPVYQNTFEAYVSDTAKYYIYNDYVITQFNRVSDTTTIDNTDNTFVDIYNSYTSVDYFFPIYDEITMRRNKREDNKAKSEIKKVIIGKNNPNLNYIKEDTLEQIVNRDLK